MGDRIVVRNTGSVEYGVEEEHRMIARIPLVLEPQPEGGYTVTSPLLPELITEGDTVAEALANAEDAFAAVAEIYEDRGCPLPPGIYVDDASGPLSVEAIVSVP